MRRILFLVITLFLGAAACFAQVTFPSNGAPFRPRTVFAFVNANIWQDEETLIRNGVMIVQDGRVQSVAQKASIPEHAVVYDLQGKYVYPSFIDLYSEYGMPAITPARKGRAPQMESAVKGAFGWNQALRPEVKAKQQFVHQPQKAEELRRNGIGYVMSFQRDGIVRGSGVLAALNSGRKENESVVSGEAAGFYSFSKGTSTQDYPSSLTGAIALLRQTYYDAEWYSKSAGTQEFNITLHEFNNLRQLPAVFEADDKYNAVRAARIGSEFGVTYIIKGGGNEYQRLSDIAATRSKFIIPVDYPLPYDVEDVYDAEAVSFAELKHWEMAPANAAMLEKAGVDFCFTSHGLKETSSFLPNIRKAIRHGLSEKAALRALTTGPARFVAAGSKIGALKKGYIASFFISSKPVFEDDAVILQHWVAGDADIYASLSAADIRGSYDLSIADKNFTVKITGDQLKPKAEVIFDTLKRPFKFSFRNELLSFSFPFDTQGVFRGAGAWVKETRAVSGRGQNSKGEWLPFTMTFVAALADSAPKKTETAVPHIGDVVYPFTAFGEPLPDGQGAFRDAWNSFKGRYSALLIKNASVWTNESEGILTDHDVYVVDGKIVRIAPEIEAAKLAFARVIDAKGMHLTAGIIDEHSHIALTGGVNEGTKASSSEVRMADVVNPEDINIYRQLSGGVTTAQLLHGSANPIGGQSAIIKLRWGHNAEGLLFEGADPFIKFALGENVKQSNWGDHQTVRFPQSRMGVEQVYNDYFTRGREYVNELAKAGGKGTVRRDLELDAIAEILQKKRFITCHSYVQSEINMLMHLADSFGFKVNTFTHILEGYKVADKMKAHGAYASTFSDWWAYKNEVMEAIPYNAALLSQVGVVTAINSDDAEMARRLNQEAAKAVKYGGLSETEALKLVTLNPAKMLHIDDKVGSIKTGKVADLVLWSDHPLSVYARAEKTIVDGRIYFDRTADLRLRQDLRRERARIISKLLAEKNKGANVVKPAKKEQKLYHCDTMDEYGKQEDQ